MPAPARWGALRRGLTLVLLAGLAVVLALRTAGLARHSQEPSARGERRWMGWAWRWPEGGRELAQAAARLAPGEPVVLVVDPEQTRHADWWRFMASYHLDRNPVVGVEAGEGVPGSGGGLDLPGEPPVGRSAARRVRIGAGGQVEVADGGPRG